MARTSVDENLPVTVCSALKDLGVLVASARKESGMTQQELARRVGVGRATVARIEQGAGGVAIGWVLTAAWVLGLPILRHSDFAAARPNSAVGVFLERLNEQLPKRVREPQQALDDDF